MFAIIWRRTLSFNNPLPIDLLFFNFKNLIFLSLQINLHLIRPNVQTKLIFISFLYPFVNDFCTVGPLIVRLLVRWILSTTNCFIFFQFCHMSNLILYFKIGTHNKVKILLIPCLYSLTQNHDINENRNQLSTNSKFSKFITLSLSVQPPNSKHHLPVTSY